MPRIQCGLCTRITEVNSMGHYDGPRGGGNDVVKLGAIDGWFFGHKAEWLFYEAYLEPKNCIKVNDFIPNCDILPNHDKADDNVNWVRVGRNFISLTDGFAFDLVNQTYCKITDPALLLGQRQKTYMKEYSEAIAIANEYSTAEVSQACHHHHHHHHHQLILFNFLVGITIQGTWIWRREITMHRSTR